MSTPDSNSYVFEPADAGVDVSQQIREVLDWPFASALVGVLTLFVTLLALIFSKTLRFDRLMGAQT